MANLALQAVKNWWKGSVAQREEYLNEPVMKPIPQIPGEEVSVYGTKRQEKMDKLLDLAFAPGGGEVGAMHKETAILSLYNRFLEWNKLREMIGIRTGITNKPLNESAFPALFSEFLKIPKKEFTPVKSLGLFLESKGRWIPKEQRVLFNPITAGKGTAFHEFAHVRQNFPQSKMGPERPSAILLEKGWKDLYKRLVTPQDPSRAISGAEFYHSPASAVEHHARETTRALLRTPNLTPAKYDMIYMKELDKAIDVLKDQYKQRDWVVSWRELLDEAGIHSSGREMLKP